MKLGGLNTYDSLQIKEIESKFNLNCYNKEGVITGYNYYTEFDIPLLPIFQRKYKSTFFDQSGKDSVIPGSPQFLHENETTFITSGLVKPDVSLFLDTTKFDTGDTSNYLRKATEFNSDYYTGTGPDPSTPLQTLIGAELFTAMRNYGTNSEVYRDVVVAVSYSGPYGESGLTKFRINSNMLHFFTIIHGADEYRYNPNYKYVNIYVMFGSYTELQLLNRIEIDDLLAATDRNINIKTDDLDKQFYMTYNTNELAFLETNSVDSTFKNVLDNDPNSSMINANKNVSSIIYSGLFQFEAETLVNPSWFIVQSVVAQLPLVDTETHTYISSEEYTFESTINDYLDSKYSLNDTIGNSANDTPLLSSDFMVYTMIPNDDLDLLALNVNNNTMKLSSREWRGLVDGTLSYSNSPIDGGFNTTGDIYGAKLGWITEDTSQAVDSDRKPNSYDMYNGDFDNGLEPGEVYHDDTGNIIIQYWIDGADGRVLVNTSSMVFTASKYFTLHFDDIVSKVFDTNNKWQIDIWISTAEVGGIYYRVMSIDALSAYSEFITALGGIYEIANADEMVTRSIPLAYSNINSTPTHTSIKFPLRDYGCTSNLDTGTLGLFIVMNPGSMLAEVDTYTCGIYGTEDPVDWKVLSNPTNTTESVDDIKYNPDGRFQDDYSSFKDGLVNRPEQSSPIWDIDVNHMEWYDGRLFVSSRENREAVGVLLTIQSIVSTLPSTADENTIVALDDGTSDVTFHMYSSEWVLLTGDYNNSIFYNEADNLYYQYKEDPVTRSTLVLYTEYYTEFKDLYYSQQGYPEMILETNYKGYSNVITGLKDFISQLYVFLDEEVHIIRKSLTREVSGILEPTYQYDKIFDKGAIEWTVQEYEKRLFFTNDDGIFYIDAGGNFNKISAEINRLFVEGLITTDTVNYATIKDEFYILTLNKTIPFGTFSELQIPYTESRLLYCEHIAFHIPTQTFWMGNDETGTTFWVWMSKDFSQRNKYENEFLMKQLKRLSISFVNGALKMWQTRNAFQRLGEVQYSAPAYNQPVRHTLSGSRCSTYGFLFSAEFLTEMRDFHLLENGK